MLIDRNLIRMRKIHYIHFVGIGGVGMSGIAEVLFHEGYEISGSDLKPSMITQRLIDLGVKVFFGHDANNIKQADVIVVSSAIDASNPEIVAAYAARIPVILRAEMLAELMRFRYGIALAGTHGKTTTTSLTASILSAADLAPTFVIGGKLMSSGSNACLGAGKYLVAEADESDSSFLHLQPTIAAITNIDADHMENYQGDFECLKNGFIEFIHCLPFYGLAILCIDDPNVRDILPRVSRSFLTYGFDCSADIRAIDYMQKATKSYFTVKRSNNCADLPIELNLPGQHNVQNALAAIAIATELNVSDDIICKALANFSGIGRRFQLLGDYYIKNGKAILIDDYGHHPKEIAVTIKAARNSWPKRRLAMIFQPHRYTRTRDLFGDFVEVLSNLDLLIMLPVYAANEKPIPGANSSLLCHNIRLRGKVDPIFLKDIRQLQAVLDDVLKDGDVLLTQGAGSVSKIVSDLLISNKF